MPGIDVTELLDPHGPRLQKAARGTPNEARAAVMVHWGQIERAIQSGYTISTIYRVLVDAGLLSISLRSFHRQVQARREGAKGASAAAKPAAEPRSSAAGGLEANPGPPAIVRPDRPEPSEKRPGLPERHWRKGPRVAPDPNFVFKPRDPLTDD